MSLFPFGGVKGKGATIFSSHLSPCHFFFYFSPSFEANDDFGHFSGTVWSALHFMHSTGMAHISVQEIPD